MGKLSLLVTLMDFLEGAFGGGSFPKLITHQGMSLGAGSPPPPPQPLERAGLVSGWSGWGFPARLTLVEQPRGFL